MTDVIEIIKTANLSQLIRTTYDYQLAEAVRERLVRSLETHRGKQQLELVEQRVPSFTQKAVLYDT